MNTCIQCSRIIDPDALTCTRCRNRPFDPARSLRSLRDHHRDLDKVDEALDGSES